MTTKIINITGIIKYDVFSITIHESELIITVSNESLVKIVISRVTAWIDFDISLNLLSNFSGQVQNIA